MIYRTQCTLAYTGSLDTFEDRLTELFDTVFDLDGPVDVDLAANLAKGTAEISMTVEAPSSTDAIICTATWFRTAFHTIGVATPGWDEAIRDIGLLRDQDDELLPA